MLSGILLLRSRRISTRGRVMQEELEDENDLSNGTTQLELGTDPFFPLLLPPLHFALSPLPLLAQKLRGTLPFRPSGLTSTAIPRMEKPRLTSSAPVENDLWRRRVEAAVCNAINGGQFLQIKEEMIMEEGGIFFSTASRAFTSPTHCTF